MSGDLVFVRAKEPLMYLTGIVGFVVVLLISGCARGILPCAAPSQTSAPRPDAETVARVGIEAPPPSASPPAVAPQAGIAAVERASGPTRPTTMGASTGQTADKTAPPVAKAPAKSPASPATAVQPLKQEGTPSGDAKPKPPPLDLASLEQRLKETKAIGILTKITLKNQVDDLLNQFRSFYRGTLRSNLADLRRSYDLLVLKVLSLLQDSDQALATAIATSREAIWGVLSDPAKFAKI
ncbi:MAG: hypothetical protein ABI552_10775 [Casimicrobiaceae bacterium]